MRKATVTMNVQPTLKYGVSPNDAEKKYSESEEYKLEYDFSRIKKIEKASKRCSGFIEKSDKKRKKKLRSQLPKGELVLVLSSRLKKKDAPTVFCKSTTDQKCFFNNDKEFVITHRFEIHNGVELYRVQEVRTGRKLERNFLRKELFELAKYVQ